MDIRYSVSDFAFRPQLREHEKSRFLGYANATILIHVDGVLVHAENIRELELKVVGGRFRVDAKSDHFVGQTGEDVYVPRWSPRSLETRNGVTAAVRDALAEWKKEQAALA